MSKPSMSEIGSAIQKLLPDLARAKEDMLCCIVCVIIIFTCLNKEQQYASKAGSAIIRLIFLSPI